MAYVLFGHKAAIPWPLETPMIPFTPFIYMRTVLISLKILLWHAARNDLGMLRGKMSQRKLQISAKETA